MTLYETDRVECVGPSSIRGGDGGMLTCAFYEEDADEPYEVGERDAQHFENVEADVEVMMDDETTEYLDWMTEDIVDDLQSDEVVVTRFNYNR